MRRTLQRFAVSMMMATLVLNTAIIPAADVTTIQVQAEETDVIAPEVTEDSATVTPDAGETTSPEESAPATTQPPAQETTPATTQPPAQETAPATTTQKKTETTQAAKPAVEKAIATGKTTKKMAIRASKSTKAKNLKTVKKNKKVEILTTGTKWVKVRYGKVVGYLQGKYIKTTYGNASSLYKNALSGKTSAAISIYAKKSSSSKKLASVPKKKSIKVLTVNSKWVKVKYGNVIGYALGSKIKLNKGGTAAKPYGKGTRLVNYAKKFLGNRYVWGGSSLTRGTDCSGFVMALYRHYGYKLPHSSYAQRHVGRAVHGLKNAKPGDIICYSGHVAIYMGGNKVIHASNPKSGIKITKNAAYRHIVAIRRIF